MMHETRSPFPLLFATALLALGTIATDADASVAFALTLDDVAKASSLVARVTPIEQTSAWEDGRIVTSTRARLERVVAGSGVENDELRIRTLGGIVDGVGQWVEGEAVFEPKSKATSLVFLARAPKGDAFAITGRAQGQLVLQKVAGSSHERVRLMKAGVLVRRAPERIPYAAPAESLMIASLDGHDGEEVTSAAARAWERTHAAR